MSSPQESKSAKKSGLWPEDGLAGKGTAKVDEKESGLPSADVSGVDEERIALRTPPALRGEGVTNDGAGIRIIGCRPPNVAEKPVEVDG